MAKHEASDKELADLYDETFETMLSAHVKITDRAHLVALRAIYQLGADHGQSGLLGR